MTVHFIGAGPGAEDLLTVRAINLLKTSPLCLYAGSIIPKGILAYCPPHGECIDTAALSLTDLEHHFLRAHQEGKDIARLHSGDLSLYSAMAEQISVLNKHTIPYTITPGVPAFSATAAALGCELTLPYKAQSLIITRLEGRASSMPESETLENFAQTKSVLAIHLAIHRIQEICERLIPFYGENCPAAVGAHVSWPQEKLLFSTLALLPQAVQKANIERTALILVGKNLHAEPVQTSSLYREDYHRRFKSA
ncbi:precorrin-4 C(11)-methyltransferase [Entomobacter blattae]|uniref:Precorrin-4 C(11)-methyltransferase n=1 Tax=Entomobacter blattae TaxID=2762277 RepID=A0A7H1NQ20_9PROT|nr:precorrin-4 C(11)-methyltransferase [Entomobacter blattae]QNT77880.1 Precorrin-4 C(11)-methyltransferase [Entomobacter blattae]